MTALEKALTEFKEVEHAAQGKSLLHSVDARAKTVVVFLYIIAVLSVRLDALQGILLFWVFPIVGCAMGGISYGEVLKKSLYTLPFIAFIGIFNPLFQREPELYVGSVAISRGWVEFVSILVRGLLSVQMVLVLIMTTGFYRVCRGLGKMKMPAVFTTQLLLVYRYIYVLVEEAIDMDRARKSRSYGRKGYSLKMWGTFVGQLLIRTVNRAQRIHLAMLSRGFSGGLPSMGSMRWRLSDTVFVAAGVLLFAACRLLDVNLIFNHMRI